jgi:uncharacterized protein
MVDLAGAAVAAILTRAPSAGGKSRLFDELRRPPDPALLTALLLDTFDAAAARGVARVVAVEPPDAGDELRHLLPGIEVIPQAGGTLGDRMAGTMRVLFERGARAVALVGSDLPDLRGQVLEEAFAALEDDPHGIVLGPARDGGYYLIAGTFVPPVFEGIEWGTPMVLAQTIASADRMGIPVRLTAAMRDVDTVADLREVTAPRTRAWVALML